MNSRRLLARILRGEVANIAFGDLVQLLIDLGFTETGGRGSHHVYIQMGVRELVNLQHEMATRSRIKSAKSRALFAGTI